jgi:6-phosphofructokinase
MSDPFGQSTVRGDQEQRRQRDNFSPAPDRGDSGQQAIVLGMANVLCGKAGNSTINGPVPVGWSIRRRCCNLSADENADRYSHQRRDCPGLNAVLRGAALAADKLGWEMLGFRDGFEGLLPPGDFTILDRKCTENIMALGGTLIGTTNRGHFVAKIGAGDRAVVAAEVIEKARKVLCENRVEALVIVGGDGSMTTALQLQEAGINCVGVPKTIDNDLEATAMTFGFDSAVAAVVDALDRLHTTATSHKRAIVVEVMGRHAGWIALHGGLAGGADVILIPEIPFDFDKVATRFARVMLPAT